MSFGGGRVYLFHNTLLQPAPIGSMTLPRGVSMGLASSGGAVLNHVSRNNIFEVFKSSVSSIKARGAEPKDNDFDYDLYNGRIVAAGKHQRHGIKGVAIYDHCNGPGQFALAAQSAGYDAGAVLPNFNDNYTGKGPDIGAYEAGAAPMEFGTSAYLREKQFGQPTQVKPACAPRSAAEQNCLIFE